MGGGDRVARHHAAGKLDVRQRISRLLDDDTFVEIGQFVGAVPEPGDPHAPADGFVAGFGRIDGRPVLAGAEDFTVLGGSIGTGAADKRYRLAQLAAQEGVPLVMILEGAGHRLTNRHVGRRPNDLQALAELSGQVPMVCLVLGPSAGHGALTAVMCDFVVMSDNGALFTAGPPLVKAALGEDATKEQLGGPHVQLTESGVAHNGVRDDDEALALARRYLSYFPLNCRSTTDWVDTGDTGPRVIEEMLALVPPDPRRPYSMSTVVRHTFDAGTVLEIQPQFGRSIVCALARLGGHSVAVVANDPGTRAGTIDCAAADKAAHFLDVAGAFHLPVVFLADNPGVLAGTHSERQGMLRRAARLFMAQHRLDVTKLHVTMRKAFGFGSSVMGQNSFDHQTITYAFPTATLGSMPADSGSAAAGYDDDTRARLDR